MEITKEELKQALSEALKEIDHEFWTPEEIEKYKIHRQYIALEMQKMERRQRLFENFKLSFVGGLALTFLAFLIWIGKLVLSNLDKVSQ
jgi:hypothetical protein